MHPSNPAPRLFLASGSPRRRELLARLDIPFQVVVSGIDEVLEGVAPVELVRRLAVEKVRVVSKKIDGGWVLGADTTIDLDGEELAKPIDAAQARSMLQRLRGRWHQVFTGVALIEPRHNRMESAAVSTRVLMRDYSDSEIDSYVATGEPMDKAGAYAIQGIGGGLVERIEGCYCNVMGLPLCETVRLLKAASFPATWLSAKCLLPSGRPCPRDPMEPPDAN